MNDDGAAASLKHTENGGTSDKAPSAPYKNRPLHGPPAPPHNQSCSPSNAQDSGLRDAAMPPLGHGSGWTKKAPRQWGLPPPGARRSLGFMTGN